MLKAPCPSPVICDLCDVIHNSAAFCFTEQNTEADESLQTNEGRCKVGTLLGSVGEDLLLKVII